MRGVGLHGLGLSVAGLGGGGDTAYLVYDTFTDANGTLLTAHTPDKGGPWVKLGSYDIDIQTNRASGAGAAHGQNALAGVDAAARDVVLSAPLSVATGGFASVAGRVADATNWMVAHIADATNNIVMYESIANTVTSRATASVAIEPLTDYDVRLILQGAIATAFLDGANRIQYRSLTNTTATRHGLRMDDKQSGPGRAETFTTLRLWFSGASTQTLWSGSGMTDWLGRPVLLVLADGTWLAAYRQGSQHNYDDASVFHLRFSDDEGATWTAADTLLGGGTVTGAPFSRHGTNAVADAILMPAPNGDILLHVGEINSGANPVGTWQYRSTDGGATWTAGGLINSDTEIFSGQDYVVIGGVIFVLFWKDASSDGQPNQTLLYSSGDNGTTWALVSAVTTTTDNTGEAGLVHLGGDTLLCILRDHASNTNTYQRISTDLGQTWGTLTNVTGIFGVFHRPRMRSVGNRVYLYGRDLAAAAERLTVLWYSDDQGMTWEGPYYLNTTAFADGGYCDLLRRSNGQLYLLTYEGSSEAASVVEYVLTVNR